MSLENLFRILAVLAIDIEQVWPQPAPTDSVDDAFIESTIDKAESNRPRAVRIHDILKVVCETSGVELEHLQTASRRRDLSQARTVAAALIKEQPHLTLVELSRILRRDVSSLSHCLRRIKDRLTYDRQFRELLEESKKRLIQRLESL